MFRFPLTRELNLANRATSCICRVFIVCKARRASGVNIVYINRVLLLAFMICVKTSVQFHPADSWQTTKNDFLVCLLQEPLRSPSSNHRHTNNPGRASGRCSYRVTPLPVYTTVYTTIYTIVYTTTRVVVYVILDVSIKRYTSRSMITNHESWVKIRLLHGKSSCFTSRKASSI